MNWHYALDGQPVGPVGEWDLQRLAQAGTITASTLVWHDGLPDWQPLSVALPDYAALGIPAVSTGAAVAGNSVAGTVEFAGFWLRTVARVIDIFVISIPQLMVQNALLALVPGFVIMQPGAEPTPEELEAIVRSMMIMLPFAIVINATYTGLMLSIYGATVGKMVVNLKVIKQDGSRLTLGRAVGRYFAEILSGMICGLGYIMVAFDSEKRSLHDQICSTRVIKSR